MTTKTQPCSSKIKFRSFHPFCGEYFFEGTREEYEANRSVLSQKLKQQQKENLANKMVLYNVWSNEEADRYIDGESAEKINNEIVQRHRCKADDESLLLAFVGFLLFIFMMILEGVTG